MRRCLLPAAFAALLFTATADAAKVSGRAPAGYTVIALAPSGQAATARVADGRFAVTVPAAGATLHLVTPGGSYFGPVILGRHGRRGIVALSKRGGAIGTLRSRDGYATARAPRRAVSPRGAVRLRRGAPLGAGTLGYVRLKGRARIAQNGESQPGGDPDGDAIPSTFDADDNGNGTLDAIDPQTAMNAGDGLFSEVQVTMAGSLNANAGGISASQVDGFVRDNTVLNFFYDGGYARGAAVSAVNVDCGTLSYCRPGDGTATISGGGNAPGLTEGRRWVTLDGDGDGYPDVPRNANFGDDHGGVYSMSVRPNVTTADLHAGDLYQARFTTSEGLLTVPTALNLFFVSTPALASYDAGAGPVSVGYPAGGSAPGTDQNPIVMTGDTIRMTFWRPQRGGIGDEPAFVDMGGLGYGTPMTTQNGTQEFGCPAATYSGLSGTLRAGSGTDVFTRLFPLRDTAADAAPDAANVLRFTLDLGACLRAAGEPATGRIVRLPLQAVTSSRRGGTDRAAQTLAICLPGCTPPSQNGPGGG